MFSIEPGKRNRSIEPGKQNRSIGPMCCSYNPDLNLGIWVQLTCHSVDTESLDYFGEGGSSLSMLFPSEVLAKGEGRMGGLLLKSCDWHIKPWYVFIALPISSGVIPNRDQMSERFNYPQASYSS